MDFKYKYRCWYGQKTMTVECDNGSYQAQCIAARDWGVKPKDQHKISVVLVEKDGKPVVISPNF